MLKASPLRCNRFIHSAWDFNLVRFLQDYGTYRPTQHGVPLSSFSHHTTHQPHVSWYHPIHSISHLIPSNSILYHILISYPHHISSTLPLNLTSNPIPHHPPNPSHPIPHPPPSLPLAVPAPWLDGRSVVFGEVVYGHDVVREIEHTMTNAMDTPIETITIVDCGVVNTKGIWFMSLIGYWRLILTLSTMWLKDLLSTNNNHPSSLPLPITSINSNCCFDKLHLCLLVC